MRKIIATIGAAALLVTLGATGSAVAGSLIGSADIKDDSIRSRDIHDGTIKVVDLKASTITALKGQSGVGPAGPKGDTGEAGQDGVANLESDGPYPGATNLQDGDNSTEMWVGDSGATLQQSWVMCAPGKKALGGGFSRADEGAAAFKGLQIVTSQPVQVVGGNPQAYSPIAGDPDGSFVPNGWLVEGFNNNASGSLIVRPHVVCATVN